MKSTRKKKKKKGIWLEVQFIEKMKENVTHISQNPNNQDFFKITKL